MHRFRSWCADTARLLFGLLYWNYRKERFVRSGRKGACPCHDPSDSGRPGETRCEAVLTWHQPQRFRSVCPLLQRGAEGWRCSVSAAEVRPFWGRAWAGGVVLAFALYVMGASAFWIGWRLTGVRTLAYVDVLWPGRWHRLATARADVFLEQAGQALAQAEPRRAYVALSAALAVDPDNYRARLLMAQINQFEGAVMHSDAVFADLLKKHPEKIATLAITYHDTLLALGRTDQLAEFCLRMVQLDPQQTSHWVRSLLLSLRLGGRAPEFRQRFAKEVAELAPHAQWLIDAEVKVQSGDRRGAQEILRHPYLGSLNPLYAWLHVEAAQRLPDQESAWLLYNYYSASLPPLDNQLALYRLERADRQEALAEKNWESVLQLPLGQPALERLLALLIEHPDTEAFRRLHRKLMTRGGHAGPVIGLTQACWVTAVVCGATAEADYWAKETEKIPGARVPTTDKIAFGDQPAAENSVLQLVNQLTLPREVIYSLLLRQSAAVPKSPRATR